jgi:hypothetical protein
MYERGYLFVGVCSDMDLLINATKKQFQLVKQEMMKK